MASSNAAGESPAPLVLSCALVDAFLETHGLSATAEAFRKERKKRKWTALQDGELTRAGIKSLEDLITKWDKSRTELAKGSESTSESSDGSSAELESEEENDKSDEEGMHQCQWQGCRNRYHTARELFVHACDDHVGSKSSGGLTLSCGWPNCSYGPATKRDHITSHMRVHIEYKPYKCEWCESTFARKSDQEKHLRTHDATDHSSGGPLPAAKALKRKARDDGSEAAGSKQSAKRVKRKHASPLDGADSDSSAVSSSSESPSSSSDSDSDRKVVSKPWKKVDPPVVNDAGDSEASSSSSSGESSSSDESSDSASDSDTSSLSSESKVSVASSDQEAGTKLQEDDDQATSNSSGTVQGDKKKSPEAMSSEDIPPERKPIQVTGVPKKHVGAQATRLAQLSAMATSDSQISNAYVSYNYADRAYKDLSVTRGKGFTKEKNKKKRGSYRGGVIDISGGKAFKFED